MLSLGDVRYQVNWIRNVAAMAAGFHLFSTFSGDAEGFLSATFLRLVVGFESVTFHFWKVLGSLLDLDLKKFSSELTFSFLAISPYLLFIRKVRIGSFSEDNNKILAFLNFCCFTFISSAFGSHARGGVFRTYEFAISVIPFLLIFCVIMMFRAFEDFNYRKNVKIIVFFVFIFFFFSNYFRDFPKLSYDNFYR